MNRIALVSLAVALVGTGSLKAIPSPQPAGQEPPAAAITMDKVNQAVVAARIATKEKRYADAEALMQPVNASRPELIIPRMELALAQLGSKKYSEAEQNFKIALGIDTGSLERAHSQDFYQQPDRALATAPSATRASRNTMGGEVNSGKSRSPELLGTGYASLGEIYSQQGKLQEAQAAFDDAAKANPTQAPLYYRNEMIFFFQAGNADGQLAAAEKAIALEPGRAMLYYFKGQALVSRATVDPQTQRPALAPECIAAYRKYLELEPAGQYSADARGVLAAAGIPVNPGKN